jgi:hypothetical protein
LIANVMIFAAIFSSFLLLILVLTLIKEVGGDKIGIFLQIQEILLENISKAAIFSSFSVFILGK